ncbi:hypothetical protein [Roseibium sediminicola]|uniref:Lipoprotein n=1 Tax=Roseibium sediminicola TaxID=2933272 RepID=A0ABT0GQH6_9HYPH|nr:hypothetical protein [Roseibium sp. CAU 1639]MCK7611125.1 hypothetical protein [Roseibium sp. CAU 1639]
MRSLFIVAIAFILAGCQTSAELQAAIDQAKPVPASTKTQIVDAARDYLVDPYSVRDAEISYMQLNKHSGLHWLCVKANSKNRLGGYAGRQAVEITVRDGKLYGYLVNSAACNNSALRWQPFPKLEALRSI